MPTIWTDETLSTATKEVHEMEKSLKEMRNATIVLEGDLRVKIIGWDSRNCVIRYGKYSKHDVSLPRRFMTFRYLKEKTSAVER